MIYYVGNTFVSNNININAALRPCSDFLNFRFGGFGFLRGFPVFLNLFSYFQMLQVQIHIDTSTPT